MMVQENNGMAQASMILGIISIVGVCCCYGGLLFGSLAVIFAFLSKTEDQMADSARIGLITGIIGIVLSLFTVLFLIGAWLVGILASLGGW